MGRIEVIRVTDDSNPANHIISKILVLTLRETKWVLVDANALFSW